MSNSEAKICSKCGKRQEEESIFCGSCGADLSRKTEGRSIDNRTLTHRPLENEEFTRKNSTSGTISRFTPGSENSGEFDKSTFADASFTPSRENATKAVIIAIATFFINSLFIPTVVYFPHLGENTVGIIILAMVGIVFNLFFIPTILGLRFIKQAELDNEDNSIIKLAQILLAVQVICWLIVYIGGLTLPLWARI